MEAFDEDPLEDVSDIDDSIADYPLYARLTCLPCIHSNLKCDEALPRRGLCKDPHLECYRVGDTQDRRRKGKPQSDIRL